MVQYHEYGHGPRAWKNVKGLPASKTVQSSEMEDYCLENKGMTWSDDVEVKWTECSMIILEHFYGGG